MGASQGRGGQLIWAYIHEGQCFLFLLMLKPHLLLQAKWQIHWKFEHTFLTHNSPIIYHIHIAPSAFSLETRCLLCGCQEQGLMRDLVNWFWASFCNSLFSQLSQMLIPHHFGLLLLEVGNLPKPEIQNRLGQALASREILRGPVDNSILTCWCLTITCSLRMIASEVLKTLSHSMQARIVLPCRGLCTTSFRTSLGVRMWPK